MKYGKALFVLLLGISLLTLSGCGWLFNQKPVAVIKAGPTSSGSAPLEVLFDGSSSYDPDGAVVSYKWDFGDGSSDTSKTVSHVYQSQGTFTARLTVIDDKGAKGTDSITINVGEGSDTLQISGKVELPSGSPIVPSDLQAVSLISSSNVDVNGDVTISCLTSPIQAIIFEDAQGHVILLGYVFAGDIAVSAQSTGLRDFVALGGRQVSFDARSTALSLIMFSPLLATAPSDVRLAFAIKAVEHSQFQGLVSLIENTLISDPQNVLDPDVHPEIYQLATQIPLEIFGEASILSAFPEAEGLILPHEDGSPYIEDSSSGYIYLVNPTAVYYAVGAYDYDHGNLVRDIFILDNRDWKWFQWPPWLEDPTKTRYPLDDKRIAFKIRRCGPLDDPVAKRAIEYNGARAILHVLSLFWPSLGAVSIDAIAAFDTYVSNDMLLGLGATLAIESEASSITAAKEAMKKFIKSLVMIIKNSSSSQQIIRTWIKEISHHDIKNVGRFIRWGGMFLRGFITAIDVPNKIAFFYYLVTAPKAAQYKGVEGYNVQKVNELTYIPSANATANPPSGPAPLDVTFKGNANDLDGNIAEYEWDFDDSDGYDWSNPDAIGSSASHTYDIEGSYTATLRVVDNDGSWDTDTVAIQVGQPIVTELWGEDSASNLLKIDPNTGAGTLIGPIGFSGVTDIAFTPDGRLYGIAFNQLLEIDPNTGEGTAIGPPGLCIGHEEDVNALVSRPDGTLLAASFYGKFLSIDPNTGCATIIGYLGFGTSGDFAFAPDGRLFAAGHGSPDALYLVDPDTGASTLIGPIGYYEVYGLTFAPDGQLYGASNEGPKLIKIDLNTGAGKEIGTVTNTDGTIWGLTTKVFP